MARPRKQGLDWFQHDTDAHARRKLSQLRARHGLAGIGFWWSLLEIMYGEGLPEIPGRNPEDLVIIAHQIGCDRRTIARYVSAALDMELLDRAAYDSRGVLTSDGIKARWAKAIEDRTRHRIMRGETPGETPGVITDKLRTNHGNNQGLITDSSATEREKNDRTLTVSSSPSPDPLLTSQHLKTLSTGLSEAGLIINPKAAEDLKDLAARLALAHAPIQASEVGLVICRARGINTVPYLDGILKDTCKDGSMPVDLAGGKNHGRRTGKALPPTVGHFPQACTDADIWAEAAAHEERLRKLAPGNGHGNGSDVAAGSTGSSEDVGQQPVSPPG